MSSQAIEIMEGLPGAFLPDKAGSIKAVFQFNLEGEGGGQWALQIADGKAEIAEGVAEQPDCALTMAANDFALLYKGQLNPVQAFMAGKVKVTGNVGLVMQLLNWFDTGA